MIGFYEKLTGEMIEQEDVQEDVEGMGWIRIISEKQTAVREVMNQFCRQRSNESRKRT